MLLIIPDGQLQMSGNDAGFLVVPGGVTSQLKDLCCQILHNSCHVDRCASAHPLGVVPFSEEPVDSPHWELQSSPARARLGLAFGLSSLATARHLCYWYINIS